jgi:hypothetical protein
VSRFVAVVIAMSAAVAHADVAENRVVYLAHGGVHVTPGENDARAGTSSVIAHPVEIPAWQTTPEIWGDTVACIAELYAPFAVTITDIDPGDVPHVEAVFGGSPQMLGLPRTYGGASPFMPDCSVIENSIAFTFTDILGGDATSACWTMAQEIAHGFGLDHELLDGDVMSVDHAPKTRAFLDEEVACGEGTPRPCGASGTTCRARQSSFAVLAAHVGLAGEPVDEPAGGCSAGGSPGWAVLLLWRRRQRPSLRTPNGEPQ